MHGAGAYLKPMLVSALVIATITSFASQPDPQFAAHRTAVRADHDHPFRIGEEFYSQASKNAGEEGVCKVRLEIDAQGHVVNPRLVLSTGFARLDESCLQSVANGRMIPATEDGRPVSSELILPITWLLAGHDSTAKLANPAAFEVGASYYPAASLEMKQEGDCIIHFLVSVTGEAEQISILQSTGFSTLDYACVMAVKHARFIPAHKNGQVNTELINLKLSWKLPR